MAILGRPINVFVLNETEQALAKTAADFIVRSSRSKTDTDATISADAKMLVDMLCAISEGKPVFAFAADTGMTIGHVASYLDTSEKHVNKLIDEGIIRCRADETGRIVLLESLLAYGREQKRRLVHLNEIVRLSTEMGLYDDE